MENNATNRTARLAELTLNGVVKGYFDVWLDDHGLCLKSINSKDSNTWLTYKWCLSYESKPLADTLLVECKDGTDVARVHLRFTKRREMLHMSLLLAAYHGRMNVPSKPELSPFERGLVRAFVTCTTFDFEKEDNHNETNFGNPTMDNTNPDNPRKRRGSGNASRTCKEARLSIAGTAEIIEIQEVRHPSVRIMNQAQPLPAVHYEKICDTVSLCDKTATGQFRNKDNVVPGCSEVLYSLKRTGNALVLAVYGRNQAGCFENQTNIKLSDPIAAFEKTERYIIFHTLAPNLYPYVKITFSATDVESEEKMDWTHFVCSTASFTFNNVQNLAHFGTAEEFRIVNFWGVTFPDHRQPQTQQFDSQDRSVMIYRR